MKGIKMPSYKTRDLKESRAKNIAEMRAINDKAETEKRDFSGEERKRFDEIDAEVRKQNARLSDAEKLEQFERLEERGETVGGDPAALQTLTHYSIAKAIMESRNDKLTGVEAEWHQELSKDRGEVRGVMVPVEIILAGEKRALTTVGSGSNLIATDLAAMTDRRRPALKIESMGATVLRGLTGNLDLPRLASSGSAGRIAEHTNATRSDPGFSKKGLRRKTISSEYEITRAMSLQSSTAMEPVLRADLSYLISQALDNAALRGGGANEPTGILADVAVQSVTGGAFSSDISADLIAALETDNVTGTTGFLTNTAVMNTARKIKDTNGRLIPLAELFHNERVESSTQVPADLGVGSDKNALIYGEWASLYIGYWSGVDLLVNPYHADVASKGGALLHAFLDADVVVRHPEGFRYAEID